MTSWHALQLFPVPAAILITLSLSAGCGGRSEENGKSGGGAGEGGSSLRGSGGAEQGDGGRLALRGGTSSGGAPSSGGSMTTGGSAQGGEGGCLYAGKSYRVGEQFRDEDGCNDCTCFGPNTVGCTSIACPPSSCGTAQSSYTSAIAGAKLCDPAFDVEQCTALEPSGLNCGCPTFVNPANAEALNELARWRDTHAQNKCGEGIICGPCLEPHRGYCNPSGQCEDTFETGAASCLVKGKVSSRRPARSLRPSG